MADQSGPPSTLPQPTSSGTRRTPGLRASVWGPAAYVVAAEFATMTSTAVASSLAHLPVAVTVAAVAIAGLLSGSAAFVGGLLDWRSTHRHEPRMATMTSTARSYFAEVGSRL